MMCENSGGIFKQLNSLLYGWSRRNALFKESKDNLNFIQRLELVSKLNVHSGCVNTTCWNDSGSCLLSGSDDQHLIVTDPYSEQVLTSVHTSHRANIFCARFLPCTSDNEVVSCSGDGKICYTNLEYGATNGANLFDCHVSTTYKVAVVPGDPHTFLSCGEDGTVRWFDLRTKTCCSKSDCKEDVLIKCGRAASALCVNPRSPWHLATGCADSSIRIYDRRMLSTPGSGVDADQSLHSLLNCFYAPGLENKNKRITCLVYNPNGQELLASYSSDNVYLFNLQGDSYSKELQACVEIPAEKYWVCDISLEFFTTDIYILASVEKKEEESKQFNVEEKPLEEVVHRSPPQDPHLLSVDEAEINRQQGAGIHRLRLRGDWSDTGPNARPERGREPQREENPTSNIMQRMSAMLSRWLDTRVREATADEGSPDIVSGNSASGQGENNPDLLTEASVSVQQNVDLSMNESVSDHESSQLTSGETESVLQNLDLERVNVPSVQEISNSGSRESGFDEIHGNQETIVAEEVRNTDVTRDNDDAATADINADVLDITETNRCQVNVSESTEDNVVEKEGKNVECNKDSSGAVCEENLLNTNKHVQSETVSEQIEGMEKTSQNEDMTSLPKVTGEGGNQREVPEIVVNLENIKDNIKVCSDREKQSISAVKNISENESSCCFKGSQMDDLNFVQNRNNSEKESKINFQEKDDIDPTLSTNEILGSGLTRSGTNQIHLQGASSHLMSGVQEICDKSEHLDISEASRPPVPQIIIEPDTSGDTSESATGCNRTDYEQKGARPKVGIPAKKSKVRESQHKSSSCKKSNKLDNKKRTESQASHSDAQMKDTKSQELSSKKDGVKLDSTNNESKGSERDISGGSTSTDDTGAIRFVTSESFDEGPCVGADKDVLGESDDETIATASTSSQNKGRDEEMETEETLSQPQVAMLKEDLKLSSDEESGSSDEFDLFASTSEDETSLLSGASSSRSPSRLMARTLAARRLQSVYRRRKEEKAQRAEEAKLHKMKLPRPRCETSYTGHRNARTMIKEVNFWGDRYVLSGSDCGHVFIWDKLTGHLVNLLEGDRHVVNCVQPHPYEPILATSGIDYNIKVWSPTSQDITFDNDTAKKVIERNEVMLAETRDTVTVPASFMLRLIASIHRVERARNQDQPDED